MQSDLINLLEKRCDNILYTYRTHEKAADKYEFYEKLRKRCSVLLTIFTTGTLITSIAGLVGDQVWGNFTVAVMATIATGASFTGEFFDFESRIDDHKKAAVNLRFIFQEYESLILDVKSKNKDEVLIRQELSRLQCEEKELLVSVPRTTRRDYQKARASIHEDSMKFSCSIMKRIKSIFCSFLVQDEGRA